MYDVSDESRAAILAGTIITSLTASLYLAWRSMQELKRRRILIPNPVSLPVDNVSTHRKSLRVDDSDINLNNVSHVFREGLRKNPGGNVFAYRDDDGPYKWISYKSAHVLIRDFRRGLLKLGLKPDQSTKVGILAKNSPQWSMTVHAALANRMVAVPLYVTLGETAMTHILEESQLGAVVCENDCLDRLCQWLSPDSKIRTIITIGGEGEAATVEKIRLMGIKCYTWEGVGALGSQGTDDEVEEEPTKEDLAVICYTSGTTGKPKGAMLTHGNIVAACLCMWDVVNWDIPDRFDMNDILFSYLPAAHVYGLVAECGMLLGGASIGYFRGDTRLLLDDVQALRPTVFPAVPRVLNKIYDKIQMQLEQKPAPVKWLFDYAVKCKEQETSQAIYRTDSIWDKLLFRTIQDKLGGRVKLILSGSAPIQEHIATWFRAVLGCPLLEGYGQTETTACSAFHLCGDIGSGHVGVPPLNVEVKLRDVPEMGHFVSQNKGEVCVKGPNVFKGYYKQEEMTAEVMEGEWVLSGDIGTWTSEGRLILIDRKKNIFKLAQGEYIAPEKIEVIYELSPYALQVFVHGESTRASLVAIVVLDEEYLATSACPTKFQGIPPPQLAQSPEFNKFVLNSLQELGKGKLNSFEQVKKIHILPQSDAFTIENNMVTPTFKKKRRAVQETYRVLLDDLYTGLQ